ncbi:4'-phosphopantetheinyl transferase superfamily protein [Chitinophaga polysaccharea]|uniref:4'-phosphopantetheinyl transferase superfamily protein n=1 Tax=Chitinophaga TaxID=79328 RepID=UPI001454F31D|nr:MULTISPECIES: 4'-phosphopantetheinyl transferase superfamily protein [Chitinophaga]NLR58394.1 4'-phosphopantetheinyl transferase superfamily protein [Chitinophaga polysaccharea]NLU90921.1 4'-phosphopantetheinyl transferase superfamily protein [Chitinophaga sp. Ak27]
MIGNDIIDLHLAERESNICRRGFLDKLFLPAEQDIIAAASRPAAMIWLLWSCKEAVYKIIHRYSQERLYAPHHYVCALQQVTGTVITGTVAHQQQTWYFKSTSLGACIHTQAAASTALLERVQVFTGYHLTTDYTALLPGRVFYKDTYGIPFTRDKYTGECHPVSISHHGKYLGIASI